MKKLIILLLIAATFTGCITEKRCNSKFPPEVMIIRTDSIFRETKTIYNDTIIYVQIPGEIQYSNDTIYIVGDQIYFKPSYLKTSFAESRAYVQNNRLQHTLTQNDTIVPVTIKNAIRLTWERAERYFNQSETKVEKVKYVPWIYKALSLIGAMSLAYFALTLFIKIKGV
jgi:hypothetical protein